MRRSKINIMDVPAPRPSFSERLLDDRAGLVNNHHRGGELNVIFQLPPALRSSLTFEEAKSKALREGKLLLLNLVEKKEYRSLELNRDIWNSDYVGEVLSETFVFWQRVTEHEEAEALATLYRITKFPFLGGIHPVTGQLLHRFNLSRFTDETAAVAELIDFCELKSAAQYLKDYTKERAAIGNVVSGESVAAAAGCSITINRSSNDHVEPPSSSILSPKDNNNDNPPPILKKSLAAEPGMINTPTSSSRGKRSRPSSSDESSLAEELYFESSSVGSVPYKMARPPDDDDEAADYYCSSEDSDDNNNNSSADNNEAKAVLEAHAASNALLRELALERERRMKLRQ